MATRPPTSFGEPRAVIHAKQWDCKTWIVDLASPGHAQPRPAANLMPSPRRLPLLIPFADMPDHTGEMPADIIGIDGRFSGQVAGNDR
jgi:hypothetical protein